MLRGTLWVAEYGTVNVAMTIQISSAPGWYWTAAFQRVTFLPQCAVTTQLYVGGVLR